ncbi:hypothetical protein RRM29_004384 [Salmonella enterica]|nr:hypothetical protein [Salmonella enterica]EIF8219918.1 hypothetical protein [Salmonella enterica]ELI6264062.1 hypothetical protein [Salmonella enterica]ELI6403261.1 hypothetical protein [Salmonella enterica]
MKNDDAKLSGEYEKFALTALYLQAAAEKGRPLNITEREAIRTDFLLSRDKGVRPRQTYRRRNSTWKARNFAGSRLCRRGNSEARELSWYLFIMGQPRCGF